MATTSSVATKELVKYRVEDGVAICIGEIRDENLIRRAQDWFRAESRPKDDHRGQRAGHYANR